jgi:hypothetical protein
MAQNFSKVNVRKRFLRCQVVEFATPNTLLRPVAFVPYFWDIRYHIALDQLVKVGCVS